MGEKKSPSQNVFFSGSDIFINNVGEFYGSVFFCVGCSCVCLHGTVQPASCIHVVVQSIAPHDGRSRPVPCHGWN